MEVVKSVCLSTVTPAPFWFPHAWDIFQSFALSWCVSIKMKWVSCRQYAFFKIHLVTSSLLIGEFNSFIFKVINDPCSSVQLLSRIWLFVWHCSILGFPVHHQIPELVQTHVHWVSDAIQPSHPLSSPSLPAFNLSQHQGLFQWVSSLHQVAKILELQLQHQSFQWIFRTYFLYDWLIWTY